VTSTNLVGKPRILVIDDDEELNQLLTEFLGRYGLQVTTAAHPETGLRALKSEPPDLLVLDVMLPGSDGFAVCRKIRETSRLPIIMLTARGDLADRVLGLELGADDYLPKPFEPRELVARIQAVLRRGQPHAQSEILRAGELVLNLSTHSVTLRGKKLEMTTAEFELLALFMRHRGKVLTRERILEDTRGLDWESFDRSVDVLVSRLRQKLKDDPKSPAFLKTIWGRGYSFLGEGEDA
jgi:DNA-binding response OmpR family regulator